MGVSVSKGIRQVPVGSSKTVLTVRHARSFDGREWSERSHSPSTGSGGSGSRSETYTHVNSSRQVRPLSHWKLNWGVSSRPTQTLMMPPMSSGDFVRYRRGRGLAQGVPFGDKSHRGVGVPGLGWHHSPSDNRSMRVRVKKKKRDRKSTTGYLVLCPPYESHEFTMIAAIN